MAQAIADTIAGNALDAIDATDATTPSNSSDSAVARVFNLPELLEHILFCLADLATNPEDDATSDRRLSGNQGNGDEQDGWEGVDEDDGYIEDDDDDENLVLPLEERVNQPGQPEPLQPLRCLGAVKRVNRMFCDTITASKKLQRLMTGSSVTEAEEVDPSPIFWLFCDMLRLEVEEVYPHGDECIIYVEKINTASAKGRQRLIDFKNKHKDSSWKDMLLYNENANIKATLDINEIRYRKGRGSEYSDILSVRKPATLGTLFQCYCTIMERSKQEHVAIHKKDMPYFWS
ncbi:hypothetical protein PRZ48_006950 [Zasmidium cellare]|uniref:Uncharacterized protein n=1 Tax=Zasmidium cellare TaxID=395010 RepID=A0ABR0EI29_ZASCE|nr:hypothetical protein PRZ48_006950 [Zasmidium cellare]